MLSFGVTVMPDPPPARFVELMRLAEANGFDYGWTFDSHVNMLEPYPLLALAARATERLRLGLCVTNPVTREPTVTASSTATLHDTSGGRMVLGLGRGDSSQRVIGMPPMKVAEFERAITVIKDLANGRPVTWNGTEIELKWAQGRPEIPLHVAAYGPRVLGVAGRVADGVFIQLADPPIVKWIMDIARRAAAEAGRDPDALEAIVCAPALVSDDLPAARDETRFFPAMVSNHVLDMLRKHPREELPRELWEFVESRTFYDYAEHGRIGARHAEFVDDETCDRFSILGTVEDHVAKLRALEAVGVTQVNVYLMTREPERTVELYGREVIPRLAGAPA